MIDMKILAIETKDSILEPGSDPTEFAAGSINTRWMVRV